MSARHLATTALLSAACVAVTAFGAAGAGAQDPSDGSPYNLPTPTPTETPTVTPTATPPAGLELLRPVPVVRFRGQLTVSGARITLLTVRTPPRVRIVVRCKGGRRKGCPARRKTVVVPGSRRDQVTYRLSRYEREYRAGAVLHVHVVRRGTIGKYSRFRVRLARKPVLTHSCSSFRARAPRRCPL